MDTLLTQSSTDNSFSTELIVLGVALILIYLIFRYAPRMDTWLLTRNNRPPQQASPWPLWTGIALGVGYYILGLTYQKNAGDHLLMFVIPPLIIVLVILAESFVKFGFRTGLIRSLFWVFLTFLFALAGLYFGLIFSVVASILIIFYFIRFWSNKLKIQ